MSKRVVITLMPGSFEHGFPAILQIFSRKAVTTAEIQVPGRLPSAPELWQVFQRWQLSYRQMGMPYQRIEPKPGITNFSCHDLGARLVLCFNDWLNSGDKEWQKIRDSLQRHLNANEEIEVLIQTEDTRLRRLPWQIWDFFEHYPLAEVALSLPEYRRYKAIPSKKTNSIRILAILGNSTGIDVERDKAYLKQLSVRAEIEFLVEPQPEQLSDRLWERGWDMLFFAGHSSSQEEGQIWLNQTESLSIASLKFALRRAVANGLRLAIFNSCDGLSLADKLADLQIGQIIVMREPVPDAIAQAFLKHFLAAFTRGETLFAAVREARQKLHILERDFPCASWLPAIVTHVAEVPPTWRELSGWQQRDRASLKTRSLVALVGSILTTALVLGIRQLGALQLWELQAFDLLVQWRSPEPPDPRLLIVTVTESDVQNQNPQERRSSSLSDRTLTRLLAKIQPYEPKVIGLDIYRDFSVSPQYENLKTFLQENKRFVGVCEVGASANDSGIRPPPELPADRSSFSDIPVDFDGLIRRQLLGMAIAPKSFCQTDTSFSFRLAQLYFAEEGLELQQTSENLQIGDVTFRKLQSYAGGYQNLDARGFQIMLNYRSSNEVAKQVTLAEILDSSDSKLSELIKNRIVLIGTIAPSFKDYFPTPLTSSKWSQKMPGVIIQAHMTSQILSAVLDKRPLIWWLPAWGETVWVWCWSLVGGGLGLYFRSFRRWGLASGLVFFSLYGVCFLFFLEGGWIPLVPSAIASIASGGSIFFYYARRSNR